MYLFAKEVDPLNGPASSNLALSARTKSHHKVVIFVERKGATELLQPRARFERLFLASSLSGELAEKYLAM